jgi:hypothetical protein
MQQEKPPSTSPANKANGGKKKEKKSYLEVSDVLTSQLEWCKPSANKKAEPQLRQKNPCGGGVGRLS